MVCDDCLGSIKNQLASETFPGVEGGPPRFFQDMPFDERAKLLKDRLKTYCQKVCPELVKDVVAAETANCKSVLLICVSVNLIM